MSASADPARTSEDPRPRWTGLSFLAGLAGGIPLMTYGVWWLLHNAGLTHPPRWALTLGAAVVAHDLVLVPVVAIVGALLARLAPSWARVPVQYALGLSLVLALVAYPALSDSGRRPSNPTLLPRDLATGLALVLAGVWVAALVWALSRRQRSRPPTPPPGG